MSNKKWAKNEINIALTNNDCGYTRACYHSAYKAFESLTKDGHSGMSIGVAMNILNRLVEGKPLTMLEDTIDDWVDISAMYDDDDKKYYMHKRYSALFKDIHSNGSIHYQDVDRVRCIDIDNTNAIYSNGFITNLIDSIIPISLPYYPQEPIKVYVEDFLTDIKNGDYDSKGVLYAILPDGEKLEINKFYHEKNAELVEIDKNEYDELKTKAIRR